MSNTGENSVARQKLQWKSKIKCRIYFNNNRVKEKNHPEYKVGRRSV